MPLVNLTDAQLEALRQSVVLARDEHPDHFYAPEWWTAERILDVAQGKELPTLTMRRNVPGNGSSRLR